VGDYLAARHRCQFKNMATAMPCAAPLKVNDRSACPAGERISSRARMHFSVSKRLQLRGKLCPQQGKSSPFTHGVLTAAHRRRALPHAQSASQPSSARWPPSWRWWSSPPIARRTILAFRPEAMCSRRRMRS
jgi:hypothetical protein